MDPGLLSQIHLSGESSCPSFTPHMLKANMCVSCNKLINKHTPQAIPDDQCLLKALEFSQKGERTPSCIISPSGGMGGLYHGGFKGVMNSDFLVKDRVTHIVNTAKGLEIFGPKYLVKEVNTAVPTLKHGILTKWPLNCKQDIYIPGDILIDMKFSIMKEAAVDTAKKSLGVVFLELGWEDTTEFSISEDDLVCCVQFVHEARKKGGSVLIHCAQGKSRSATAVIAYMMACYQGKGVGFEEGLKIVQSQRKMAEPNPTFTKRLQQFEKSAGLQELRRQLN